jgi:uncharacterized protein YwbE
MILFKQAKPCDSYNIVRNLTLTNSKTHTHAKTPKCLYSTQSSNKQSHETHNIVRNLTLTNSKTHTHAITAKCL